MLAMQDDYSIGGVCYTLNSVWLCSECWLFMLSIHDVYAGYPGWVAMFLWRLIMLSVLHGWLCCLANYARHTGLLAMLDMPGGFQYACYAT
jgi:hypothetical protein